MDQIFLKTIKIFLMDGDPNKRMSCELSNWVGKAYKIPRSLIKKSSDREELNSIGVYFLFGKDPNNPDDDMIYIGQTENIFNRLKQHIDKKEFWNNVITIISKDENLNRAHVRYLEYKLHKIAKRVNRFKVENTTRPKCPSISEPDRAEMQEFIHNIKLLVNTLGYKVFEDITKEKGDQTNIFKIKAVRGTHAKGQSTSEGFVVLKGSEIANSITDSASNWINNKREELIKKDIISHENDKNVFKKDYLFNSPSTAAAIVMGRNDNGLTEWKLKNGKTLKEFEQPQNEQK